MYIAILVWYVTYHFLLFYDVINLFVRFFTFIEKRKAALDDKKIKYWNEIKAIHLL